jgi:hypothetical protein
MARPQERKFLGFSFTAGPDIKRRIAPKSLERFKQRIREITRRAKGVSIKTTMEELVPYMRGWRGYFGFCETPEVLIALTRWVRLRLRSADQSRMPQTGNAPSAIHGPHFSVHRTLLGLWDRHRRVATGLASGGMPAALHVTDDTARHLRYTSRAKREADVSLSHRCTMEHHDATGVTPRDKR